MTRFLLLLSLALCAPALAAGPPAIIANPDFEQGMTGWNFQPGGPAQAAVTDGGPERGKVLDLHPDGKLLGVETDRLAFGKALSADTAYEISALLKNEGLQNGVFAFSIYCYDAANKKLKQISFFPLDPKVAASGWLRRRGEIGPGTANPLPEGTASICVRFSFYDRKGDCRGKVLVDDVTVKKIETAGRRDWPREIVADTGDLQVRFESRSFWTLYRIDYRGTRLCLDNFGSHYGSVANFPGVGFIGSGHTENEEEQVLSLALTVDGKPAEKPQAQYRCNSIMLQKESRIRDLHLHTSVTVAENRIVEDVRLQAEKATPVNLIYHFMHPWINTATEYLAVLADGTRVEGAFNGDDRQKLAKPTRWSAIYDGPSGKGAVTYVLAVPQGQKWETRYWDTPTRYRKHYFVTFQNETVPAGKEFHYRVVTVPFAAAPGEWKEEAAQIAAACASQK